MRIVWISQTATLTGGAELVLLEAVRGLKSNGHEIHVIVPLGGDLVGSLEALNVPVSIIPFRLWIGNRLSPVLKIRHFIYHLRLGFGRLSKVVREIKPDLVVTNTLTTPFGAFGAMFARTPHIWYIHEFFGDESHGLFFDYGTRFSLLLMNKLSKRLIVNSHATFNFYKEHIPASKLRMIYCAVDVPSETQQDKREADEFKLIAVGALSRGKRQEDALRALSMLVSKGLNMRLVLVGTDLVGYGDRLRMLASKMGVSDQVEFVQFTKDPFSHFASADIALMCSIGEAFGRVTVEAMKLGTPVIGADTGGTAELITHGSNGFLYRPGDCDDLAQKIEMLYWDRSLLRKMGENARTWANETFNYHEYVSSLLSVFNETIHSAGEEKVTPMRDL